jgi:selenocysteine-specific elongation factor
LEGTPAGLGAEELTARTGWLAAEIEASARHLEKAGRAERVAASPLWLVHQDHYRAAVERVLRALESFHRQNPLAPGVAKELLRAQEFPEAPPALLESLLERLKRDRRVAVDGEIVRLASHRIVLKEDESQAREKLVAAFEQAGLAVPGVAEVLGKTGLDRARAQKILQILLREKILIRVAEDFLFHHSALDRLKALLAEQKKRSGRISVPQFKELTGISRKYAIPLLEFLDRERITCRAGDERIIL